MPDPSTDDSASDARLANVVKTALTPLIAADGGAVEWVGVTHGVAEIRLGGNCAGCPGQTFTVNHVVLPALRAVDPSIRSVRVKLIV